MSCTKIAMKQWSVGRVFSRGTLSPSRKMAPLKPQTGASSDLESMLKYQVLGFAPLKIQPQGGHMLPWPPPASTLLL